MLAQASHAGMQGYVSYYAPRTKLSFDGHLWEVVCPYATGQEDHYEFSQQASQATRVCSAANVRVSLRKEYVEISRWAWKLDGGRV